MKRVIVFLLLALFGMSGFAQDSNPLRVFIRSGPKTHGPGQHDHPRFLEEWTKLLNERGAKATGKMGFPTAEELENTDVLVMYLAEGGTIEGRDRENLEEYLARGGGIVTIHDAVCGNDPQWFKTVVGGAWEHRHSKWHEGEVGLYFLDTEHPITRGISNFDFDDEIYYDLHMMPEAKVLASSFHSVFVIAPQIWTYEKDDYRSFVCLQGHQSKSFDLPHFRAILLRGIAWAGKRDNVDMLCSQEELGSLKYPEGGPTAPEEAAEKLIPHPEFTIDLVAAEPLIEKAISMDWDAQGRLWVAETPEYPGGRTINENDAMVALWAMKDPEKVGSGGKVNRKPKDRISWLEDTNGDGRMDRKQVFADGLELVTSLVFYKDGVIVTQAPDILWLRDTNGDGKCDMEGEKVKLYTGFGTFDTHAVINNLRWGMDGWIYSAIGYSAGNPTSGDGSKSFGRVTAGVIRFKPDGSALEQVASGSCNTWGFDFAADGEAFYTTATCGEHFLHVVMPEKILARGNIGGVRSSAVVPDHQEIKPAVHHTRPAYVQIDWVGRFTAAAGCAIYTGGAWPERYNGSHFCSETTMSLVHNDFLRPKGVTYVASKEPGREETEFIAGTDLWFRPVHTRVGPDGALYVIDFYNQAAIHNDTRGPKHGARNAAVRPDRDHHFGRIWRVQHKDARPEDWKIDPEDGEGLVEALDHPNGWVRMTAQRLLVERGNKDVLPALAALAKSEEATSFGRIHALWTAYHLSQRHDPELMFALYNSTDEALRKSVMQLIRNYPIEQGNIGKFAKLFTTMAEQLRNPEGRLRLETIMAMAAMEQGEGRAPRSLRASVWDAYPTLNDPWTESAIVAILAENPEQSILEAADMPEPALYARTVRELANRVAAKGEPDRAARVLIELARKPAEADSLKKTVLEAFSRTLREDAVAQWTPELREAFAAFISSRSTDLQGAALPLIARWDHEGSLENELQAVVRPMLEQLANDALGEELRGQVAANLIGVRRLSPNILPAVLDLIGGSASVSLQKKVLEALGNASDPQIGAALVEKYPDLRYEVREETFAQLIRRAEWTSTLLEAVKSGDIALPALGPSGIHRLRTHADRELARRAVEIIEEIRGPEIKEKNAIIDQLAEIVAQRGNIENGKSIFTQNCASCHKFKGEGSDLAPDLTGMGAHGPHDLLVHIVDPNRVIEPNFVSVSIETKDELSYDGIVARENRNVVVLQNANGQYEIRQDNILSRRSTGMSLMPNGFEALGPEGLRDLISYIAADENKYRILDFASAATVDSTKGIYNNVESVNETLRFRKFGITTVEGVPFDVLAPTRSTSGKNLIVLKGGHGFAKTLPQKVEIPVGVRAGKLHFLGGVGGWAFPCCGENKNENMPVARVTVHYRDNATEELILRNGVEFADYNGKYDVPGSEAVPNLVRSGQVRWFTKNLPREDYIEKITIASYDNSVAPTFVAITAESSIGLAQTEAAPASPASSNSNAIRTLIVGGGSSHDFGKWFNEVDSKTLERGGLASVEYTEDLDTLPEKLKNADVLYLCTNNPMDNQRTRKAIFDFADAGKGLVLVHPGLWYNWKNWPEYNSRLVGGGSRGHDRYGEFTVEILDRSHPLTMGVPAKFDIRDELYHHQIDQDGSPVRVLAKGHAPGSDKSWPVLWVTQHPKARIVCLTLGHDGAAHNGEPYQKLLRNAVRWAAGK